MRHSGYGGVTRPPMMKRDHLCVQVEPSARVGFASVLEDIGDLTVTSQSAPRIVAHQKEEEFVI